MHCKKTTKVLWGSSYYLTSGQSDWQKDRHRVIWKKNHATVCSSTTVCYLHHTNNYLALHSSMLACMLSRYVYKVCTHSGTKKCSELVLFYILSQVTPLAWTKYLILTHNVCMKILEIFENAAQNILKEVLITPIRSNETKNIFTLSMTHQAISKYSQ